MIPLELLQKHIHPNLIFRVIYYVSMYIHSCYYMYIHIRIHSIEWWWKIGEAITAAIAVVIGAATITGSVHSNHSVWITGEKLEKLAIGDRPIYVYKCMHTARISSIFISFHCVPFLSIEIFGQTATVIVASYDLHVSGTAGVLCSVPFAPYYFWYIIWYISAVWMVWYIFVIVVVIVDTKRVKRLFLLPIFCFAFSSQACMVSVGSNYVTFVIIPLPFVYIDIFLSSVGTRQSRKPKAKLTPPYAPQI